MFVCEYCLTPEVATGTRFHVKHIQRQDDWETHFAYGLATLTVRGKTLSVGQLYHVRG
ncbi:MAG: hypothetical protein H7Y38_04615 [Armatimonadetes bacterium]|nr:hypothetical protein [Armatimonadota bacterium]